METFLFLTLDFITTLWYKSQQEIKWPHVWPCPHLVSCLTKNTLKHFYATVNWFKNKNIYKENYKLTFKQSMYYMQLDSVHQYVCEVEYSLIFCTVEKINKKWNDF